MLRSWLRGAILGGTAILLAAAPAVVYADTAPAPPGTTAGTQTSVGFGGQLGATGKHGDRLDRQGVGVRQRLRQQPRPLRRHSRCRRNRLHGSALVSWDVRDLNPVRLLGQRRIGRGPRTVKPARKSGQPVIRDRNEWIDRPEQRRRGDDQYRRWRTRKLNRQLLGP